MKLNVAILGFGRSGQTIHGDCLSRMLGEYRIAAVVERMDEWRKVAEDKFGAEAFTDYKPLLERRDITYGDAEDYVKMLFKAPGKPVVNLEASSCCAYPFDTINIQGSCGGIRGPAEHLEMEIFYSGRSA